MKKIIIFLIDFYRNCLSPLKLKTCRFYPTCSTYVKEAILKKGVIKGILLGLKRISKCNPFCLGGNDPLE